VLRRFIGLSHPGDQGGPAGPGTSAPRGSSGSSGGLSDETATVRRIVGELDSLPPDRARFLAAFAYILSREAMADFEVSDAETAAMEQIVVEHGRLTPAQAVIVVQIARSQSLLFGATEDFLVTREFRNIATEDERLDLLRCCFLVGAADGGISAEESGTLAEIADQLDVDRTKVNALRAEFADQMTAIKAMRAMRAAPVGSEGPGSPDAPATSGPPAEPTSPAGSGPSA
jgi:uncharacterized tellurite resistance protein B-like protein